MQWSNTAGETRNGQIKRAPEEMNWTDFSEVAGAELVIASMRIPRGCELADEPNVLATLEHKFRPSHRPENPWVRHRPQPDDLLALAVTAVKAE
jgi:hypothetical protein